MSRFAAIDFAAAVAVVLAVTLAGMAYGVRALVQGRVRSARVERAGSSVFLGRLPMEAAYFAFEPLARLLVAAGVRANAVTATGVALSVFAAAAAASGVLGLAAAIGICAAMLDALDGIVARNSTGPTDDGALYDAAADRYMEFFLLAGLAIHLRESLLGLATVLGALFGGFMVSYISAKSEVFRVDAPRGSMRRAERAVYVLGGLLIGPFALRTFPTVKWAYTAPAIAACALVAVVANASAYLRLLAVARAVTAAKPTSPSRGHASAGTTPAAEAQATAPKPT